MHFSLGESLADLALLAERVIVNHLVVDSNPTTGDIKKQLPTLIRSGCFSLNTLRMMYRIKIIIALRNNSIKQRFSGYQTNSCVVKIQNSPLFCSLSFKLKITRL